MTNMKYEVWMDGIALSSLSGDIFISSIVCKPATITVNTAIISGRDGERVENVKRKGTTVTVQFYLRKSDNVNRESIVREVAEWARKGILQTSDKQDKRLHVMCVEPPYVPDVCDWTTPISIKFQAFEHPFWEETTQSAITLSGTSGSGTLFVPGNAGKTPVEVTVTPSSSMANITLTVGSTSVTLTDVSATSSAPLIIDYDENGFLRIRVGSTSVLSKRTGSDDLLAECGEGNTVSFTASAAASVTFKARGLWL